MKAALLGLLLSGCHVILPLGAMPADGAATPDVAGHERPSHDAPAHDIGPVDLLPPDLPPSDLNVPPVDTLLLPDTQGPGDATGSDWLTGCSNVAAWTCSPSTAQCFAWCGQLQVNCYNLGKPQRSCSCVAGGGVILTVTPNQKTGCEPCDLTRDNDCWALFFPP